MASAGTNNDADNPLTAELVEWADVIVVMEKTHRTKLRQKFRKQISRQRVICLDVPDDYAFMDAALVDILNTKMRRFLPSPS